MSQNVKICSHLQEVAAYDKRFLWQVLLSGARVLTIYTNLPGGNLVHKHKTKIFDVVGEQSTTKYIQIGWTD